MNVLISSLAKHIKCLLMHRSSRRRGGGGPWIRHWSSQ